jgi:hypothetical protein
MPEERIEEGIRRLGAVLREVLGDRGSGSPSNPVLALARVRGAA